MTCHLSWRIRLLATLLHCTLIGGKGGAGPSLLHTTLEGPTEYVKARRMESRHGFLHGIQWIAFHGHSHYSQKPLLGGRSNTKPGDHGTPNTHKTVRLFYFIMCEDPHEEKFVELAFG